MRKSVAGGRCGNVEATFVEFCCCSTHCQVATLRRPKMDQPTSCECYPPSPSWSSHKLSLGLETFENTDLATEGPAF